MRQKLRSLTVVVLVGASTAVPSIAQAAPASDPVQLVAINDFHGAISPAVDLRKTITVLGPDAVNGGGRFADGRVPAAGAVALAATVQARQFDFRSHAGGSAASFFVSAGDLIGASPHESAAYAEEPTIEVLNQMGLDVSVVGNHEFDRGTQELRRLSGATDGQYTDDVGACDGVTPGKNGCYGQDAHAFTGAQFPYLAANVVSRVTGQPMFPPYQILFTPSGTRLALIGVVTRFTAKEAPADAVLSDVDFLDEADTVNLWTKKLRAQGIEAIGVLLHEGGVRPSPPAPDPNTCDGLTGPVLDINKRIDPAVDFLLTAHTHHAYNCMLPVDGGQPRLVTQAAPYGEMVTDLRLTLDRRTGDVDRSATYSATNVNVKPGLADASLRAVVAYWLAGPGHQQVGAPAGAPAARKATTTAPTTRRNLAVGILTVLIACGAAGWYWQRGRRGPRQRVRGWLT